MIPEELYQKIIRFAIKAPSPLNTQPWRFEVEQGLINLLPDFSRSLPESDPYKSNLYISMGCALKNLMLASRQFGFEAVPEIKESSYHSMISIRLRESSELENPALFHQIGKRQVVQTNFNITPTDEILITKYAKESLGEGISIIPLIHNYKYWQVSSAILNEIASRNNQRAYIKEHLRWMRFNDHTAMIKGDGIRSVSLDQPFSGTLLNRLFIHRQLRVKNEVKRWRQLMNHSSGLVLFAAQDHAPKQCIKLGISFQHFVLSLSRSQIKYSHIPVLLNHGSIRTRLAGICEIKNEIPLQLIRIGKAQAMPYSFRRNIIHNTLINL